LLHKERSQRRIKFFTKLGIGTKADNHISYICCKRPIGENVQSRNQYIQLLNRLNYSMTKKEVLRLANAFTEEKLDLELLISRLCCNDIR